MTPRAVAKAAGAKVYFTGRPCRMGHEGPRITATGSCRECFNAYRRERRARNPGIDGEQDPEVPRRYRARLGKAACNARTYAWKRANPEKNRAHARAARTRNPEVYRVAVRRRRARLLAAPGDHDAQDIADLYEAQAGLCAAPHCYADLSGGYHVDHVTPVSREGSNGPENLQLLCAPCNQAKGARTMDEWLPSRIAA